MIRIIAIKITDRIKEAGLTQEILSRHASVITTRLGFHELTDELCSREACIILHLNGEGEPVQSFLSDLGNIGGTEMRIMDFDREVEEDVSDFYKEGFRILGILTERNTESGIAVQKLLTAYGCIIRTRLGVNETFFGKPAGLIILELKGDVHQMRLLEEDLSKIDGIHIRRIIM